MDQVMRNRPGGITALAVLNIIGGVVFLLGGLGMLFMPTAEAMSTEEAQMAGIMINVMVAVCVLFGALYLACGIGLWKLKSYGRTIQMVLSFIGLLGFPVGTAINGLILWYLFKPEVKGSFA